MRRRSFLKGATAAGTAVAAGTAATTFPAPAIAQGVREVRMVTTWPKGFPGLGTGAERLAQRISAGSDGKLKVAVYAAGEHVPPFESFDAVSQGTAEMYHAFDYYWQNKSKGFNFFAAVPFGMTGPEMDAWIYFGGGQELWDELAAGFNIKPFIVGNTGAQMGGWFARDINTIADIRGLKFRMPGIGGEVLRRLGAVAVALPGGEIFAALQSGAIDGTEWVGPWNDLAFGFHKIVKNYYYPGFHEPGTALACGMNKDFWDSLSATEKQVVRSACEAENAATSAEFNARNATALNELINKHRVRIRRFPNDLLNAFGQVSGEVVAEVGNSDPMTKRIYESFLAFRQKSIAWSKLGEQGFRDARQLPFNYG
jgi:TRAP-type mannitol/chloroaromatic compound transport system substrate-binding protein